MNIIPSEITQDSDSGLNIASFPHSNGVRYAQENDLRQCSNFNDFNHSTFIVCCGQVLVIVEPTDFPEVIRRIL